ncbi:uncharacterized protein LOC141655543 [Silene latifolia]|uniref:uncharacterized protein LOC141655543 n=1 Tax=Silene latifolia TaxID=37657 RepID=UPI003D77953E
MVGCWALWEQRNKVIFETREVDPSCVIVKRVRDVMEEIEGGGYVRHKRRDKGEVGDRVVARKGCAAPPVGYVKINVDAGVKERAGVGLGVMCRDGKGHVMWGASIVLEQLWESHIAEAVAVLDGVNEARRRGHEKIIVESDCLQVVEALRKSLTGRSIFALVLEDILSLCNSFSSIIWSHTSRINNGVAHALAHPFPRVVGRFLWSEALPLIANDAVVSDLSLMQ